MKALSCLAAAVAAFAGMSLNADVAIWTNMVASRTGIWGKDGHWGVPANWVDADGNALEVAPTNGTHDVMFPALDSDGRRASIFTGVLSGGDSKTYLEYPAVNPSILSIGPTGGVWDTYRWTIKHSNFVTQYRQPCYRRVFSMADASAFDGYWETDEAQAIYELRATEANVPRMSTLGAECRPFVRVPDAGTAAELGAIHQAGTVSKIGDGELKVATTMGDETRFTVSAGTLTIGGQSDDALEELLKTAALRLDATRADTIVTYGKITDGVAYQIVTNWHDVNGSGNHGYQEMSSSKSQYFAPYSHGAFISPVRSPTGLPLVDFGSHATDGGRFGPSNCWLRLTNAIDDPRAVFYAVQTPGGAPGCTILGTAGGDGMAFLTERGDAGLFCTYWPADIARNGDIMVNALPVSYDETMSIARTSLTNLNVISVAIKPGAKVEMIASDRHYTSRSGGSRLGEVLVFTNELTRADRVRVAQYLTRKWVTGEAEGTDANAVVMNSADAALSVPAGRTARVGMVTAKGGTFRKSGDGTLEVGAASTLKDANLEVNGGSVAFAAAQQLSVNAPAEDPYIWLDANDAAKFTSRTFDGDGRTFVTHWGDHRDGVDIVATAISNAPPRMPWIVDDIGNGRGAGVSLGSQNNGTQSFLALPTWGDDGEYKIGENKGSDTYAGFIVFRFNMISAINLFGSDDMAMMRASYTLLANGYAHPRSPSAFWSVNGVAADPFERMDILKQTNDVVVVGFRSPVPLTVNAIAKDRKYDSQYASAGCVTVGEFITYHRPLTEEEFRSTEAYLMDKWLGAVHPAAASEVSIKSMKFAEDVDAVMDSGVSLEVVNVSGGNGTLEKRGSGAVTAAAAPDRIDVEEGSLSLVDWFESRAIFHFDASRTDSFETYAGEDGKTYVTTWKDIGTNGLIACSMKLHPTLHYDTFVMTNPTLSQVTMPDGVARQVVDFGGYRNTKSQEASGENASSFYFTRTKSGSAAVQDRVREIYVIQRYNEDVTGGPCAHFIGNLGGGAPVATNGSTIFMRGSWDVLNGYYTSLFAQNGYLALDREAVKASDRLPAGWHLMSVGATDYTRVDAMMHDRNCNAGGGWIAEMIAFDFELTAEERASLEKRLMRKWGIGDETVPVQTIGSVKVAAGASLAISVDQHTVLSSIGGGGAVSVSDAALADGGEMVFGWRSASDVDCLAVDGAMSLDGAVTVKVEVAEGAEIASGEWTLLTATGGISGLDAASLSLDIGIAAKWSASISVRDGALRLRIAHRGTVVTVR